MKHMQEQSEQHAETAQEMLDYDSYYPTVLPLRPPDAQDKDHNWDAGHLAQALEFQVKPASILLS